MKWTNRPNNLTSTYRGRRSYLCFRPLLYFYTIMLCTIVSFVSHVCTVPYTSKNMNQYRTELMKWINPSPIIDYLNITENNWFVILGERNRPSTTPECQLLRHLFTSSSSSFSGPIALLISLSLSIQRLSLCDQLSEVIKPLFSHSPDDDDDAPRVVWPKMTEFPELKTTWGSNHD